MNGDRYRDLDWPSLLALSSLLETSSVTASARALGRTQSSLSRTLGRLRVIFDDPLLVSAGRSLRLTPRAQELRAPVSQALEGMRRLFAPRPSSPREEHRTLHVAAADYTSVVLLNAWLAKLRQIAPGLVVHVTPVDAASIDPLARGDLDLALAPFLPGVGLDQFVAKRILSDRYVCVIRKDHPLSRRKLGLRQYLKLEHVMVGSVVPAVSSIDEALHRLGARRTVAARVSSSLTALTLVTESDFAATSYARLVPFFASGVVAKPLPFDVPPLELHLMWHPRANADPVHRWVREHLLSHAASQPTPRPAPRRPK
jgi:DNA-binding transcriptional LysR family regulator